MCQNGTKNSGIFCQNSSKLGGKDVDLDLKGRQRVAETDKKNDPPFSVRFWHLESAQARVQGETIRSIEASEISSNV